MQNHNSKWFYEGKTYKYIIDRPDLEESGIASQKKGCWKRELKDQYELIRYEIENRIIGKGTESQGKWAYCL